MSFTNFKNQQKNKKNQVIGVRGCGADKKSFTLLKGLLIQMKKRN